MAENGVEVESRLLITKLVGTGLRWVRSQTRMGTVTLCIGKSLIESDIIRNILLK